MTADTVSTLEESLAALDVEAVRTTPSGFDDAIREAIVEPAVGAPFPIPTDGSTTDALSLDASPLDGVSLDGLGIETDPSPSDLTAAYTGVTAARLAIADTGSVAIRSTDGLDEPVSLYVDRHVAVVDADDVVPDLAAAFDRLGPWLADERASTIVATGPSATADMGELVRGAHGAREVCVVIVENTRKDTGEAEEEPNQ